MSFLVSTILPVSPTRLQLFPECVDVYYREWTLFLYIGMLITIVWCVVSGTDAVYRWFMLSSFVNTDKVSAVLMLAVFVEGGIRLVSVCPSVCLPACVIFSLCRATSVPDALVYISSLLHEGWYTCFDTPGPEPTALPQLLRHGPFIVKSECLLNVDFHCHCHFVTLRRGALHLFSMSTVTETASSAGLDILL